MKESITMGNFDKLPSKEQSKILKELKNFKIN